MRLLFILCEANVEARILEILRESGAPGYTRLADAIGDGTHGRREGSPVWPGLNSVVIAFASDAAIEAARTAIMALQAEREGRLAIRAFSAAADQIV